MRDSRNRATWMALGWTCILTVAVLLAVSDLAVAETRLIAHFENDGGGDSYGRDVLAAFYDSQGPGPATNLYPDTDDNLAPFWLTTTLFSDRGSVPGQPFEIHQYDDTGGSPPVGLIGENRFAAFGSGWSLGAQDHVGDFQISFITVADEDNDDQYVPGPPGLAVFLSDNDVTGVTQDWSSYDYLCFYICINAADIPDQQFFDDFKIQVWEYHVDLNPPPPQWTVNSNEREIFEVQLGNYTQPFTGWKHIRIPFSDFDGNKLTQVADSWRYTDTASQPALDNMSGTPDWGHIRALVFRKGRVVDASGIPTEPDSRITVAIDEIVVTGSTNARVARVNIPGGSYNYEDRGLCWAQLFGSDSNQVRPYDSPVKPPSGSDPNPCIDVVVPVPGWRQMPTTFSAEVSNGAVAEDSDLSSEIVFVPQFQVPGTWVAGGTGDLGWSDFSRRKGTQELPGSSPTDPRYLFCTDWRYDYTNGQPEHYYLVDYPIPNPGSSPYGGFLANYFRAREEASPSNPNSGYAYGTLFVLPRDDQGNIGRAWVIDVLFDQKAGKFLRERFMTGRP